MILSFFRHGIAVPHGTPGVAEEERPLTREGIKRTRRAAQGILKLELGIDAVVSSPLPRALQTADILCDVLRLPSPRIDDRLLPEVSPQKMLSLIPDIAEDAPVFVGHEPSLSATVANLVTASNSDAFALKKAGFAAVELTKLVPRPCGTLLMLLKPAMLRRLGK